MFDTSEASLIFLRLNFQPDITLMYWADLSACKTQIGLPCLLVRMR